MTASSDQKELRTNTRWCFRRKAVLGSQRTQHQVRHEEMLWERSPSPFHTSLLWRPPPPPRLPPPPHHHPSPLPWVSQERGGVALSGSRGGHGNWGFEGPTQTNVRRAPKSCFSRSPGQSHCCFSKSPGLILGAEPFLSIFPLRRVTFWEPGRSSAVHREGAACGPRRSAVHHHKKKDVARARAGE